MFDTQFFWGKGPMKPIKYETNEAQTLPRKTDISRDAQTLELKIGLQEYNWVSVTQLISSHYIGETILITIYIYKHYGNLISTEIGLAGRTKSRRPRQRRPWKTCCWLCKPQMGLGFRVVICIYPIIV